jgi:pyruvate-formate lyase-activating enzyme
VTTVAAARSPAASPWCSAPSWCRSAAAASSSGCTCIDTSGRLGDRLTDAELIGIDLNRLDIKSGDPAIYEHVTRQPLQQLRQ